MAEIRYLMSEPSKGLHNPKLFELGSLFASSHAAQNQLGFLTARKKRFSCLLGCLSFAEHLSLEPEH
jgi:hypothetical protein